MQTSTYNSDSTYNRKVWVVAVHFFRPQTSQEKMRKLARKSNSKKKLEIFPFVSFMENLCKCALIPFLHFNTVKQWDGWKPSRICLKMEFSNSIPGPNTQSKVLHGMNQIYIWTDYANFVKRFWNVIKIFHLKIHSLSRC